MCKLYMCFHLSLFYIMEHYVIFVIGHMYLHHMYPYEHYMSIMKGYERNCDHPEGSMIESYRTE
jgi:thiosulfate reductase cytochrome b subunit